VCEKMGRRGVLLRFTGLEGLGLLPLFFPVTSSYYKRRGFWGAIKNNLEGTLRKTSLEECGYGGSEKFFVSRLKGGVALHSWGVSGSDGGDTPENGLGGVVGGGEAL